MVTVLGGLAGYQIYRNWGSGPSPNAIVGRPIVMDGDTVSISGTRIRLEGIDAVEADQTCVDGAGKTWPCGRMAANTLRAHIRGRDIVCEPRSLDRFHRVLAICTLNGDDLNAWMVRQGWAVTIGFGGTYESEQSEAQSAKRGIWSGTFVQPFDWRRRKAQGGAD